MKIIYSDQPISMESPSVYLAGPTPRRSEITSWRVEALRILLQLGYAGTVMVPERSHTGLPSNGIEQVDWEFEGLESADAIMFWIPRDMEHLPGLTTNVEFGRYVSSGRAIYGRPDSCPHNGYLDWLYEKLTGQQPCTTLTSTIEAAMALNRANDWTVTPD